MYLKELQLFNFYWQHFIILEEKIYLNIFKEKIYLSTYI